MSSQELTGSDSDPPTIRRRPARMSTMQRDDSSTSEDLPQSTAPTRGRPAGRIKECWNCDQRDPTIGVVTCNGSGHPRPRQFHIDCVDLRSDDRTWQCRICRPEGDSSQPEPSSQQSSQGQDYDITGILAARVNPDTDVDEILLRWAPDQDGLPWPDSWEPASNLSNTELYDRFIDSGEAVFVEGADTNNEATALEGVSNLTVDDHEQANNPFWSRLQDGYWCVLLHMFDEVVQHSVARLYSFSTFQAAGLRILATQPDKVLRAICGAGLVRCKLQDPELRTLLDENMRHSKGHPCIYIIEFTDDSGRSPPVGHMRHIIQLIRQYMSAEPSADEIGLAVKVDRVRSALDHDQRRLIREQGQRYYLTNGNRPRIETLLQALEQKLPTSAQDKVPFVLRDVGYADQGRARIEDQHLRHQSSNLIMTLFEAVSIADDRLDGRYRLRGNVVFACHQPNQAALGEIMFSILAQSYVETGTGFNGVPAGVQQRSLAKYDSHSEWMQWSEEALYESPFEDNIAAEQARIAERRTEKTDLLREIHRLERVQLQSEVNELERRIEVKQRLEQVSADL